MNRRFDETVEDRTGCERRSTRSWRYLMVPFEDDMGVLASRVR